ncbi:unnamed protein product [Camellia sinensis]
MCLVMVKIITRSLQRKNDRESEYVKGIRQHQLMVWMTLSHKELMRITGDTKCEQVWLWGSVALDREMNIV